MFNKTVRPYEIIQVHDDYLVDLIDLSMLDVIGDSTHCAWSGVTIDADIVEDYYAGKLYAEPGMVWWGCHDVDNNILDLRLPAVAYKPKNQYGKFTHWSGVESVGKVTYRDPEGRYYGVSILGTKNTQLHCSKKDFALVKESDVMKWILSQQTRGIHINNAATDLLRKHLQRSLKSL